MIMNGKGCGAGRRLARLLAGRNQLRRCCDRIEGAVLVALAAAFLAALAGSAILGMHVYQSQRVGAESLRQVSAVLTQHGPMVDRLAPAGQAQARWPGRGGQEQSGALTSVTAPGISGAAAGTRILVWLNRDGQPGVPPAGQASMIFDALFTAVSAAAGAAAGLLIPYWLCRLAIDRRRLAAWESAWALTGPRWTGRH
jgi:hypothetical protein